MHLEELPVSHISLLPLPTRKELLEKLPIADVCQLEGTKFVEGIDMAGFWEFTCQDVVCMGDVRAYFKEWDDAQYHRAILYGQVATCVMCREPRWKIWFSYPNNAELVEDDNVISFLYSVRKFDENKARCQLLFPPRYHQQSMCKLSTKEEYTEAVLKCFKGELPKILASVQLYEDEMDFEYAEAFLSNVVYLGIHGKWFEKEDLRFVKLAVMNAAKLEVLILEGLFNDMKRASLNKLFNLLSSHPTFLSTLRLFELQPGDQGLVVSRPIIDKLITAFFSAFTDHPQKLHFTDIMIEAYDVYDNPDIYERFLHYKTVEFDNCQMVSRYKVNPNTISHWLGHNVSAQENSDISGSWLFQLKKKVGRCLKKRKYSETEL